MRRLVLSGALAVGLVAALLAPAVVPVPPEGRFRPVSSAVLVCPRLTSAGEATNVASAMVAGPAQGPGSASLRGIQSGLDLVRLASVGDPVALVAEDESQPPLIAQARGTWAPTTVTGIVSRHRSGPSQGLSSAACLGSRSQWWFVGGGSEIGRGTALLVSNPSEEAARFDISLNAGDGVIPVLAGKGIDVGPGASVRLRLDALAPGEPLVAIQVQATIGRVAATVRDVAVPRGDRARGVDFIPPAVEPGTRLVVAGIPGGDGSRELVLVNPGTEFATVEPVLLTEEGSQTLPELQSIAVPAGAVIKVDLARSLAGRAGSLAMTSDVPVTGGARAEWGGRLRDVVWLSAVPLIEDPNPMGAAAAVPSLRGDQTTVVIAAPDTEVRGTLSVTALDAQALSGLARARSPQPGVLEVALPTGPTVTTEQVVNVPAGSQRVITLPSRTEDDAGRGGLRTIVWRSGEDSGPAAVTHVVVDPDRALATGYSWWPIVSQVVAVDVREDLGILAPEQRFP